ncbi:MAG TPA: metal-sensing transcriptional repressor [Fastidiosipila sp.]|jgi:DNA-binding FrmR family transcriptional regulator|nr:metal-sensing transcriptional repressor [Fastidiosipila sp.]
MQAEQKRTRRLLNTAKGQIDGVLRMVEEDRYCIDISNQLLATIAILKKVNNEILHAHLNHCVYEAVEKEDRKEKLEEIAKILDTLSR